MSVIYGGKAILSEPVEKIQKWLDDWRPEAKLIEEGIKNGRIRKVNYAVLKNYLNLRLCC